jgi:hypothetical protein
MAVRPRSDVQIDPEVGIPDLVRRLTEDSKRLASDELRLAKIEVSESVHTAARGSLWIALAFGAGVIALVAATVGLAALIGWLARGHMWVGALTTGIIELGIAFLLIKKGFKQFGSTSYTLAETRDSVRETAGWVSHARAD